MPEYKRFIAYFYEYIDGKKQKNVGFAKVELRSGMWRILFRLRTDRSPDPPVCVYGFVREKGWLLGLPMGKLPAGREMTEDWIYRAETPLKGDYRMENLAGLWIQSGDDRKFLTVWDEEEVQLERFVQEIPEEQTEADAKEDPGKTQLLEAAAIVSLQAAERTAAAADIYSSGLTAEMQTAKENEKAEAETAAKEETADMQAEKNAENAETKTAENTERTDEKAAENTERADEKAAESAEKGETKAEENAEKGETKAEENAERTEILPDKGTMDEIAILLHTRPVCQPFEDEELTNCVMLYPCDIAWLRQHSWLVGRSSFLQHGFYQYRHLLLAKNQEGRYVLGVPGVRNSQEKYMAEMFGYPLFKRSGLNKAGGGFGYWYRTLEKKSGREGIADRPAAPDVNRENRFL